MFKAFFVAAACLLAQAGAPPAPDQLTTAFDAYMDAAVRVNRFTGTVLVARDGRPVFSKAYGMANLELEVPNTTRTVFRIGSITKGFTSAAIMMLQEQGKLSVHDRICQYVSGCPAAWEPVTIRHLLLHMSGIQSFTELPDYGKLMPLAVTHDVMMTRIKDLPLEFPAGEKYKYSNAGYYLLGMIIERASGKPYADYLQETIFTPLGMASSGYDSSRRIIKNRANGYSLQEGALANTLYMDMTIPFAAGALYASVDDLLRWDQALYTEKLLTRKSLDEMFTPVIEGRGYGWGIRQRFERQVIELDGGINGFSSSLSRFPDGRITVIVLANNRDVSTRDVANDLSAIVFGVPHTTPVARKAITLDAKTLDRLDVTLAVLRRAQRAPDGEDVLREIRFLDKGIGPHFLQQVFLVGEAAGAPHQRHEYFEGLWRQRDRVTLTQQQPFRRQQPVRPEFKCLGFTQDGRF